MSTFEEQINKKPENAVTPEKEVKNEEITKEALEKKVEAGTAAAIQATEATAEIALKNNPEAAEEIKKLVDETKGEIAKAADDLKEKTEQGEVPNETSIFNPKILDLLCKIEYGDLPAGEEGQMDSYKRMMNQKGENTLAGVLEDFTRKKEKFRRPGIVYGVGGWNRYKVDPSGKISLIKTDSLQPKEGTEERARALGMEIGL